MQIMILTEAGAASWNCFSAARKSFIKRVKVDYAPRTLERLLFFGNRSHILSIHLPQMFYYMPSTVVFCLGSVMIAWIPLLQNNRPRIVCLLSTLCRYAAGGNSFGPLLALTTNLTRIHSSLCNRGLRSS